MPKKVRLKIWQWLLLLLVGTMFPIYNMVINNFFTVIFDFPIYLVLIMGTNLVFSFLLLIIFNYYRAMSGLEDRLDTIFILYLLSVSFGSFFNDMPLNIALFIAPFVVIYFFELIKILEEYPRE